MAKVFRAKVTLADGEKIGDKDVGGTVVDVVYLTASNQPTLAAIKAAAKKLGVKGFSKAARVEHFRDAVLDEPDAPAPPSPEPPKP